MSVTCAVALSFVLAIALAGCGPKQLSGTYVSSMGSGKMVFNEDGKCEMSMPPGVPLPAMQLHYEIVNDNTINFTAPSAKPGAAAAPGQPAGPTLTGTLSQDWKSFTIMNVTYTKQ